jgi:membrane-associated phospholipid phosphatase
VNRLQRGLVLGSVLVTLALLLPLALLVRDGWEPLRRWDNRVEDAWDLPAGPVRELTLAVTQLGSPLLLELVAVVIALVLLRRRRRLALYVLVSVLGAELVSAGSKVLVARVRPCVDTASCPSSTSFPSGHAVGAAAFWTTVAVLLLPVLGRWAWTLLLVPLAVALSRVLLGVHYPSDVLAGLLVGGCWAAAWTAVFAAWRDQREGRDVPLEAGVA